MRNWNDLEEKKKGVKTVSAAGPPPPKKESQDVQGVFVVTKAKKAEFREVKTGLTGTTDIQVKSGLQEGDEIITGSYKVLRTLRNGAGVKVDNSAANKGQS